MQDFIHRKKGAIAQVVCYCLLGQSSFLRCPLPPRKRGRVFGDPPGKKIEILDCFE